MQDLEALHQKASGHYLQGDLESARDAWRQLLALQPEDERAAEGIRLCEQQLGGCRENVCTPGESPFAVAPATRAAAASAQATAVEEPIAEAADLAANDMDELDFKLDFLNAPAEAPAGGEDLLDLSGLGEELATSSPEAPRAPAAGEASDESDASEVSMWSWQAPSQQGAVTAEGKEGQSTEMELRRRVNELLASALLAMERGRREETLEILHRLLILDEDNDAAKSLQQKIRLEQESASQADASGEEPKEEREDVWAGETMDPAAENERPLLVQRPDSDTASGPDAGEIADLALEDLDLDAEPDEDAGADEAAVPSAAVATARSRPNRWLLVGAGAALLGGAAFLGWKLWGPVESGSDPAADPGARGAAKVAAVLTRPASPKLAPSAANDPGEAPVETQQATSAAAEIAAAMGRAAAAMRAEDYSAAVIAYNEVLLHEPDNAEVLDQLRLAGDRYREQRATEQQWQAAIAEFDAANYQEALRLFYRLPPGDNVERIQRFKVNGWYNLGVTALQAGQCESARSSLNDAKELEPGDPGVRNALRVAQGCTPAPEFREKANGLPLRGLED